MSAVESTTSANRTVVRTRSAAPRAAQLGDALEVDADARLVADHPGVVPGRRVVDVARPDLDLRPVAVLADPSAADLVPHVVEFAALGAVDGLDMGGPTPPRFQRLPPERQRANGDEVQHTERELAVLIRCVEGLRGARAHAGDCTERISGRRHSTRSSRAIRRDRPRALASTRFECGPAVHI